ncbi:hypothetical protein [uncultured Lutibacter sp.]|uniref:hypothetical protein n=1 Tax=uncultured Lutibacter sp. TaxID=437739 RepID=UPI00260CFE61|nr:hypothetical protein [uncultured Lutibacter sp.]
MKTENNIEGFTKSIIEEVGLETPSTDFVSNVMKAIDVENKKVVSLNYQPLISNFGWFVITLLLMGMSIFISLSNFQSSEIFLILDSSYLNKFNEIDFINNLKFSTTFTFSVLLFAVLVVFQLFAIKHFYAKKVLPN